jgi:hypothetical protein
MSQEPTGNAQSRSSDGSLDGRRTLKDKVKARAEAKRVRLGASESSTNESSGDEAGRRRHELKKRTSRGSRTERYLKRMCNGAGGKHQRVADSRSAENHARVEPFRPIERVPRIDCALTNGDGEDLLPLLFPSINAPIINGAGHLTAVAVAVMAVVVVVVA